MQTRIKFILLFIVLNQFVLAQSKYDLSNKIFNLQFTYNYQIPGEDFGKRYGNHHAIGFGGIFKTKNNIIVSTEGQFLFGSNLKELNTLDNLVTSGGFIANANGTPADYYVSMRGWSANVNFGKLFALGKTNKNHGIYVTAGLGFLNHFTAIQTQGNNIAPLTVDYRKGYDRNTLGIALNQFVGYYFNSKNRFINFYTGVQFTQGFTKNISGYNYDQMAYDNGPKKDNIIALKFGWLIPIYMFTKSEDEFQFK